MPFTPVWNAVRAHFFTADALLRASAMTQAASQAEGWWKTELFIVFEQMRSQGLLTAWDREVRPGAGMTKVDFKVEPPGTLGYVEVKTVLCATQKGQTWNLWNQCGFLLVDVLKLGPLQVPYRYLLVFAFAAPPAADWNRAITHLGTKAPGFSVSLARLDPSPNQVLTIAWLEVR